MDRLSTERTSLPSSAFLFHWSPQSIGWCPPAVIFTQPANSKARKALMGPSRSLVSLPVWAPLALPRGHITLTFTCDKDEFSPRSPSAIITQPFPEPICPTRGTQLPPYTRTPVSAAAVSHCRGLPAHTLGVRSCSVAHGINPRPLAPGAEHTFGRAV